MEFRVSWEIDVDTKDPVSAAIHTLALQQSTESTATSFEVRLKGPCPSCHCFEVHKENCRLRKRFAKHSSQPESLRIDQVYRIDAADFIRTALNALKCGDSVAIRTPRRTPRHKRPFPIMVHCNGQWERLRMSAEDIDVALTCRNLRRLPEAQYQDGLPSFEADPEIFNEMVEAFPGSVKDAA